MSSELLSFNLDNCHFVGYMINIEELLDHVLES